MDEDVLTAPASALWKTQVVATYFGGRRIYGPQLEVSDDAVLVRDGITKVSTFLHAIET